MPDKKKLEKGADTFITSLQFWDDKKQKEKNITGSSMEMRLNQFDAALKEIRFSPVFGRGYSYRDYYINKYNQLHPELWGFESILLLYLVERGWLGLFFFFIVILFLYRRFVRNISDKLILIMIFGGFLLSIIMTGIRPFSLLFLLLSGSVASGLSTKKSYSKDKRYK